MSFGATYSSKRNGARQLAAATSANIGRPYLPSTFLPSLPRTTVSPISPLKRTPPSTPEKTQKKAKTIHNSIPIADENDGDNDYSPPSKATPSTKKPKASSKTTNSRFSALDFEPVKPTKEIATLVSPVLSPSNSIPKVSSSTVSTKQSAIASPTKISSLSSPSSLSTTTTTTTSSYYSSKSSPTLSSTTALLRSLQPPTYTTPRTNSARYNSSEVWAPISSSVQTVSPPRSPYRSSYRPSRYDFDSTFDFTFEEEEDSYRNKNSDVWSPTTRSSLRGMRNLGNTCYMNAILQAITNLSGFVEDVRKAQALKPIEKNTFCGAFLDLVNAKIRGNHGVLNPKALKDIIGDVAERFRGYGQQDAHEFLGSCLNQIEEEVKGKNKQHTDSSLVTTDAEKQCPISRNFDCIIEHTLTCLSCGNVTVLKELCRDLSLSVDRGEEEDFSASLKEVRLEHLLNRFFQKDKVESMCEVCESSSQEAVHKVKSPPRILILHLKRFKASFSFGTASTEKINRPVRFPNQIDLASWCTDEFRGSHQPNSASLGLSDDVLLLDSPGSPLENTEDGLEVGLSDLITKDKENFNPITPSRTTSDAGTPKSTPIGGSTSYRLSAIVLHEGSSASSGHYICDAFDPVSKTWNTYNDSLVDERVSSNTVFGWDRQRNGYLFFYVLD